MKKTIPTSIASTLFYIEEDTYKELEDYLNSIRAHFANSPDSTEIIRDIEDRIREQFIEFIGENSKNDRIVTKEHVEKLIKQMGRPEDFGDETNSDNGSGQDNGAGFGRNSGTQNESAKKTRKLYRDTEHAIVGGVASGISAYFGIDPIIVRIIFFLMVILGGSGILVYIFLWIVIPEAKTASQKLEMQGDPVNLQSVSDMAKEAKNKINEKFSDLNSDNSQKKIKSFGAKLGNFFGAIGRGTLPVFGGFLGIIIKIIAIATILAITSGFAVAVFNYGKDVFDLPIQTFLSIPLYYVVIFIIFLIAVIPFIFLNALGSVLLRKKTFFRGTAGAVLFGIWMLAIVGGAVVASTVGRNVTNFVRSDSRYAQTSKTIELAEFDSLIAQNAQNITIVPGEKYEAKISGRENDIERVMLKNSESDKTLTIRNKDEINLCFLCFRFGTKIELTVPKELISIKTQNASKVTYSGKFSDLILQLENASKIIISGTAEKLDAQMQNASVLDAKDLITQEVDLKLQNASKAEVYAEKVLTGKAMNASKIIQYGPAKTADVTTYNDSSFSEPNLELDFDLR